MGKYSGVVEKLDKLPPSFEESSFEEKVAEVKKQITEESKITPASLADMYRKARIKKDTVSEELSGINVVVTALEQLISSVYEQEGLSSVKLEDGSSVSTQTEPYAKIEDREAFRKWCLAHGLAGQMTLPWQSANTIVKEKLLAGEPEPDGVKAYALTKIVLRKG